MFDHIAFITTNYQTAGHPHWGTFVEQLVAAIAGKGRRCSVIHPTTPHAWLKDRIESGRIEPRSDRAGPAAVLCPWFVSLRHHLGPVHTARLTERFFSGAVRRAIGRLDAPPDVVYGHFLYLAGASAARVGRQLGIPAFVAMGECVEGIGQPLHSAEEMGCVWARQTLQDVAGVVAVSSLLKRNLTAHFDVAEDKIGVFPNGVDLERFSPRDRCEMRRKHGLSEDRFLVAFMGHFNHRKGVLRVAEALEGIADAGGLYLGSGPLRPEGSHVLFRDAVPHAHVPELLSAADLFVLPTRAEGSCNALIEAMACGLPVVTSRGEFNDDLVDDRVAVRVDPDDVAALRHAIVTLKENIELRGRMAAAAARHARQFDIARRAEGILAWMRRRIESSIPGAAE